MSSPGVKVPYQRFYREHSPVVARFLTGMLGPDDAEECRRRWDRGEGV